MRTSRWSKKRYTCKKKFAVDERGLSAAGVTERSRRRLKPSVERKTWRMVRSEKIQQPKMSTICAPESESEQPDTSTHSAPS